MKPGPGIATNAFAPASGTSSKSNESIPLIVNASDVDQLIQTCSCPPGSKSKLINIADSVNYEWTKEGDGRLEAGGPASLYKPPDIPVAGKAHAVVEVKITDSGRNGEQDKAKNVKFTITIEREAECKYKRNVEIEPKRSEAGGGVPFDAAHSPCNITCKSLANADRGITSL